MKKEYTTLFFDLDDTLWDTAANSKESMSEIYAQYGFDKYYSSFEGFYTIYLENNNKLWDCYNKGLLKKEELMEQRFKKLFEKYTEMSETESKDLNDAFMYNTSKKTKTVDGAIDLLQKLQRKYQLHIISNGFTEVQYTKLEGAGLASFFDKVILSDAVGVNKPDSRIFKYALSEASAQKSESLMIGDTYDTDIVGAMNYGIDQVWFNLKKLQVEKNPTYEIDSLLKLNYIL